jgi:hypothetical protein
MKISELYPARELEIPDLGIKYKVRAMLTWVELMEYEKIKDPVEIGKFLLSKLIIEWNLDDEDGKPLPITSEVIERLPATIAYPITKQIMEIVGERREEHSVKKKSWLRNWFRS